jgi:hypothetical protein
MIPWFGSLKLLLTGSSAEVPSQSFEYMGLTLIGIVLAALAIHLGVKALGSSEGRSGLRGSPEAADEAAEEEEEAPAPRRARSSRSARRAEDEETESGGDDEEDDEVDPPRVTRLARAAVRPPAKRRARSDPKPESPTRRGRPRPSVQRRPPATDEDSEL